MKNKKLFAAALTAALAVSMMGTSVMAYDGTTNFKYTPGTSGPTDPINPGDEETDPNNWMVSYPRNITLMDNNESNLASASTKGQELAFKVTQRQAGADQDDTVTADNVQGGIVVAAAATDTWTSGEDITMAATTGSTSVNMNVTNAEVSAFVQPGSTVMTLTSGSGKDEDIAYAVIKQGEVANAADGETYTATVNFAFTQS